MDTPDLNHFSGQNSSGRVDSEREGGISEEQKRRSPPAPVIGLPRLSFPRDQSHRNCLLPDCCTNQLLYRPLMLCVSLSLSLGASETICAETPVVVAELGIWQERRVGEALW